MRIDVEQEFRRYADFGLICCLAIGCVAIGAPLIVAFRDWSYLGYLRVASIVLVGFLLVPTGIACWISEPVPGMAKRSLAESLIGGLVTVIVLALCGTLLALV
jgi:hypothetical protein